MEIYILKACYEIHDENYFRIIKGFTERGEATSALAEFNAYWSEPGGDKAAAWSLTTESEQERKEYETWVLNAPEGFDPDCSCYELEVVYC